MRRKTILLISLLGILIALSSGCKAKPAYDDSNFQPVLSFKRLRSTNLYGHTGIMIQSIQGVIYLDPVDLVNEDLPKAGLILVTHDHPDHFSMNTIKGLSDENTKIVSISSVAALFGAGKGIALAPGEKIEVNGIGIEALPAYNDSHARALNYLGFVLTVDGGQIYCSGDTALTPEMETLVGIDFAVLNVRKPYSLSGEDVVAFSKMVKPGFLIPIHWMPENDIYGDQAEIEYIRQNLPPTITLWILDLY